MGVDFQVIKRYMEGNEQDGDKERILVWFSGPQDEESLRREYYRYWKEESGKNLNMEGYTPDQVLGKIYHEIKLEESSIRQNTKKRIIGMMIRVAAILFIPLVIYTLINSLYPGAKEENTAYSEIYAPPGTRTEFHLPDGSGGCLNGGSTLKFPIQFKGRSREVELKGEAYFDVLPNPQKPFIVSGTNISVIALGTSFNVLAFPDDKISEVTLVSGKVRIQEKRKDQVQNLGMLEPGQMCIYDGNTSAYQLLTVDAMRVVAWKDGKLIFRNEPFEEVVKKLNRRYNANILIKDERLKAHPYMATFEDETLDEVIKLLRISAPVDVREITRERNRDGTFDKRTIEFYYRNKN